MNTSAQQTPLRILAVDDHTLFREGLRALFASLPGFELIGEATSVDEALTLVDSLLPDVVLMDIQMPGGNGIEATRRIVASHPGVAVVMVTMFEEDETIFAAMRAGARGYVLKGVGQQELLRAITAAGRGEALFGPAIAIKLTTFFARRQTDGLPNAFSDLTQREREVLDLIARGRNNGAIAQTLCISTKTVRNHVSNVLTKLRAEDRAEAIVRAREAGFGRSHTDARSPAPPDDSPHPPPESGRD